MIHIKTEREIVSMRVGGRLLAGIFDELEKDIHEGVVIVELDKKVRNLIEEYGGSAAFLGYNGFPAAICASLNDEVVHGIPDHRVLKNGDILSIDIGLLYEGMYTDMARTIPIGSISDIDKKLINVTKTALEKGIAAAREGSFVGDIGHAVQEYVEQNGFSVVRNYVGHGVGSSLHEDPQIPNFGKPKTGYKLTAGMTIAIEPMVNIGTWKVHVTNNNWTVITNDNKKSAHFEHTILVTGKEAEIITAG
ncbi:MAG: type I methionyl aminopeptidase [Elusimicrobiota bacterium]